MDDGSGRDDLRVLGGVVTFSEFLDLAKRFKLKLQKRYFLRLLEQTGGNVSYAAEIAKMDRANFYREAKRCGAMQEVRNEHDDYRNA